MRQQRQPTPSQLGAEFIFGLLSLSLPEIACLFNQTFFTADFLKRTFLSRRFGALIIRETKRSARKTAAATYDGERRIRRNAVNES